MVHLIDYKEIIISSSLRKEKSSKNEGRRRGWVGKEVGGIRVALFILENMKFLT